MHATITTAPCCWGVDDISSPDLPDWRRVLDETRTAGYGGLELGPYGYMPLEGSVSASALAERDLSIVAGTIFDDLVSPANREAVLRQAREICAFLSTLPPVPDGRGQRYPAPYLTVMDWGHDERDFAAGHSDRAPRLGQADWDGMIDTIREIADIASRHGVRAVIHPHAGGYLEFEDEIDRLVDDLPVEEAGLCLDTGHLWYAGLDPVATLDRLWERTDYIHFKDIDRHVYDRVMDEHIRFFEACAQGVMCRIGEGCLDYPAIRDLLNRRGYAGFVTVEQERDPCNAATSLEDVRASRAYLESIGFT